MNENQFIQELKQGGLDLLCRFLDVTHEEAYHLMLSGQVDDSIRQVHSQIPTEDLEQFEDELLRMSQAAGAANIEIQTTRVTRGEIIETYLSVKRANKSYGKAYARITSIVNVMNTQTNSQPVTSTVEYLQPGAPDDDMSVAIDRVYQELDAEFSK